MLETVEIQTGNEPAASVIWLHGLGADGHDFEPIVPELRLPDSLAVRFVFPHAPVRPVTLNAGMQMRAWFDILGLDRRAAQDEAGIRASEAEVRELIERERQRGSRAGRIVLAGFSQGGAIALHTALRYERRLAGIMALSAYLPLADQVETEADPANTDTPIFMAHGSMDPVLPQAMGVEARDFLHERGYDVAWHSYPMMHAVCPDEIRDIAAWLTGVLAPAENRSGAA